MSKIKAFVWALGLAAAVLLSGCSKDTKKDMDAAADEVTGARPIQHGRAMEKQLDQINKDRQERHREVEDQ